MRTSARFDEMRISGLLPTLGGLAYVGHAWIDPTRDTGASTTLFGALVISGILIIRQPVLARAVASAAAVGFAFLTWDRILQSPAIALSTWLGVLWVLSTLWIIPGLPRAEMAVASESGPAVRLARVRMALRTSALLSLLLAISRNDPPLDLRLAVIGCLGLSLGWALREHSHASWPSRPAFVAVGLATVLVIALWNVESASEVVLVLLAFLAVFSTRFMREQHLLHPLQPAWWEQLLENPARQLVSTFLFLILVGTLLLGLPLASATAEPVSFVDAAFTAVSAVCVTGLIVLDTPSDWSPAGQAFILLLIQLGGLGIMAFATAFFSALGRRLSMRQEGAFAQLTSQKNRLELYRSVTMILRLTFVAEVLGAVFLLLRFHFAHGEPLASAAWRGLFTAISAFCNAGFALQSDSLLGYANDPWVLNVVGILIITGGLSPAVVVLTLRGRWRQSLQARLVLMTSGALLLGGAILFAAFEWSNALEGMGTWQKVQNAWFQSITMRTAGFNSCDFTIIRPATVTLSLLWMFVGGSPGGTAGGIKTTTFAVLVLAVVATIRGRDEVTALRRSIPNAAVYRATSVATIGSMSLVLALLSIQLTQDLPVVPAMFEVGSALGTVGLSMGVTSMLDPVGKILVMIMMFGGRVGSLTLLVFLMAQRSDDSLRWPRQAVDVG